MIRRATPIAALAALAVALWTADAVAAGSLVPTTLLSANFNSDPAGSPPNIALPGAPDGDYLMLQQAGGSVTVLATCGGLVKPVEMKQNFCAGGVAVNAFLAPRPSGTESITLRWRSFARDYFGPLMRCEVRSPDGALIASVDYRPLGFLKYNLKTLLPARYVPGKAQEFAITVDLVAKKTSLSINGSPVTGCQGIPFAEPALDVARLTFEGDEGHAQALILDDLSAVAMAPPPDSAPIVTAPGSATGAEGSLLSFVVTVSDPDGDPISSLTAAPLPAGAEFNSDALHTSGTFAWIPDFSQAGSYSVTFTAVSTITTATTASLTIADTDRAPAIAAPKAAEGEEGGTLSFTVTASDPDGEAVTGMTADLSGLPAGNSASFTNGPGPASGAFLWPMKAGEAGAYVVTFRASNSSAGSAQTNINVAVSGVSVTGSLVWTPRPGEEGSHIVTFTAVDDEGLISSSQTEIICNPALPTSPAPAALGAGRRGAMAPSAIQKGPVVSSPRSAATTIGKTIVVTATATSGDASGLAAVRPGLTPARAGSLTSATASLTLTADLTEVDRAQFHVDQDPFVAAPATAEIQIGSTVSFAVSASDPDGDPILSLVANVTGLPSGNNAAFTSNTDHTSGLFTWTPAATDSGNYTVSFTAANNLVHAAATTIHVRGAAAAKVFLEDTKRIKLSSKGTVTLFVEPIAKSFDLADVDPASVRMSSPGTGSVSDIAGTVPSRGATGDQDCNKVQDLRVCFNVSDMKLLFSNLHGYVTAHVTVTGRLRSGGFFSGGVDLRLDAGSAPSAAISPNPLNPRATLSFRTARPGPATVRLFDVRGRMVRELLAASALEAGEHRVEIDGRDGDGRTLASGMYYFRIDADGGSELGRFTIMK